MPPLYVKGGSWNSTEDDILKAAVQKYGLHEWLRVLSLLPKKNASQAKARWHEWLSPLVTKLEWLRDEDAKLLSLAKVLPNQWRTIAQLMARTATQCAQRYHQLLDEVSGETTDDQLKDFGVSGPGIESLPGAHETTQASDGEDEEMLAEAQARLGSNQGKKAKRKARERLLLELRRLALIQKKRDLRDQGLRVSLVRKRKTNEFNYNDDIPHEKIPEVGVYLVDDEDEAAMRELANFEAKVGEQGQVLQKKKEKSSKRLIEGAAEVIQLLSKRAKLEMPKVGDQWKSLTAEKQVLATTLKTLLRALPVAKAESSVVIPGVGTVEAVDVTPVERLSQQIDAVEASQLRLQAVQRELPIPKGTQIDDDIIADEFRALVESDYRKYVDALFRADLVEDLDKQNRAMVDKLVEKELANITRQSLPLPSPPDLTASPEVQKQIATTVCQITEGLPSVHQPSPDGIISRILEKYRQLAEEGNAVLHQQQYLSEETKSCEFQVAALNKLVTQVL